MRLFRRGAAGEPRVERDPGWIPGLIPGLSRFEDQLRDDSEKDGPGMTDGEEARHRDGGREEREPEIEKLRSALGMTDEHRSG